MMAVYDEDKNGKLNVRELRRLGLDVAEDKINDAKIDRKMREIERERIAAQKIEQVLAK